MSRRDNMVWDSKRGWIKPKLGFHIKLRCPDFVKDEEEHQKYEDAPLNPKWPYEGTYKIGYEERPQSAELDEWYKKWNRKQILASILNLIPFIHAEVIE